MENTNNILLVRVPAQEAVDGRALRDYILESLDRGVLVLTEDATCEVLELPELGGAAVVPMEETAPRSEAGPAAEAEQEESPTPEPVQPAEEDGRLAPVTVTGRNREEKLAILGRLREYRRANGLGCWNAVAERVGAPITPELIRDMLLGNSCPPVAVWRRVERAAKALEEANP